jgi:DNA-binding HxlR family transcriptional regulator
MSSHGPEADAGAAASPLIATVDRLVRQELPPDQLVRIHDFCRAFLARSRPEDKRRTGPVRQTFRLFGDKWTTLVVLVLHTGTMRYAMLQRIASLLAQEGDEKQGISQRMLTLVLHNLELNGMIRRSAQSTATPRVEYTLTPLGNSLHAQMLQLIEWAENHTDEIASARASYQGPYPPAAATSHAEREAGATPLS